MPVSRKPAPPALDISAAAQMPAKDARKGGRRENLPKGFWRAPSQSLRVQVRVTGYEPVVKTFPLFKDTPEERRKQLLAATEWAAKTRSSLIGGTFISTREAEATTLGDALRALKTKGLKGKPTNVAKDLNRIDQILADEISNRSLASLQTTDIARYRDKLAADFWSQQVERRVAALEQELKSEGVDKAAPRARLKNLRDLKQLRRTLESPDADNIEREAARKRRLEIENAEGIREPARTTLGNKLQLISRALKHIRQTVNGIPTLEPVALPAASPGRERRVSEGELNRLLPAAAKFDPLLPLLIRFAIETALRRERILEFRLSYIKPIGRGQRAIVFPKAAQRQKRTGIIPITKEIEAIIQAALAARPDRETADRPVFAINPLTLDTWWGRLLEGSEIEDLHFHDLRHEATSRFFERGLSTIEVMSITGHSTTEMVDRYSHYSAGLVLDKLERGADPTVVLNEIQFLIGQYVASEGDVAKLRAVIRQVFS